MIMLDTHIAAALFEGRSSGLSARARGLLDRGTALISPAVVLELEFLHEIGRVRSGGLLVARYLAQELAIEVALERFADVAGEALALSFTRDPFDRLIVAHAALLKALLVTRDEILHRHYPHALH